MNSPRRSEMLVLRTCREVSVHRSTCGRVREGFPASCPILAATPEQQQQQLLLLQQQQQQGRCEGCVAPRRRIGFVPTMGGLHWGHLSLIRAAERHCDEVWVSIFLNPTQFQSQEDFDTYPIKVEEDLHLLTTQTNAQVLFLPEASEMYPHLAPRRGAPAGAPGGGPPVGAPGEGLAPGGRPTAGGPPVGAPAQRRGVPFAELVVDFDGIEEVEGEGKRRPGFFRVSSGCIDTRVVLCPTARGPQGLPFASRNKRLTQQQLEKAQEACAVLKEVEALYNKGTRQIGALRAAAAAAAERVGAHLEYLAFNRQADGAPIVPLGAPRGAPRRASEGAPGGTPNVDPTGGPTGAPRRAPCEAPEGPPQGDEGSLPENDQICVAVAIRMAPGCSIVDNFVLSDTHKFGDLLPPVPNSAEAVPSAAAALLPLHAAPCVLLLRSLSLQLLQKSPPAAAAAAAAAEWAQTVEELEALELSDPVVSSLSSAERQKAWPWASAAAAAAAAPSSYFLLRRLRCTDSPGELVAYLAFTRVQNKSICIQRIFVAPKERRKGIAEAFFCTCMLLLQQQLLQQQLQQQQASNEQQVTCVVPQLALKVMEKSFGFTPEGGPHEGGPHQGGPHEGGTPTVAVSLELNALAQRLLRP
ncbi:pantoate--beta-alanine ligase, putative [Eimeria tenella]|uniref:Pantoate--beta-alanine ligase n=1 Tax=Eimeria tenella TaxID=5802 RepID=U6L2K5_EIMTE|nr:pantoate--beta-alanine ligase, putative [Eimeria tenella]CDJ42849.1 pantoate--beta-alanine ligase, putative [Eimeria tenella]|eukprot:XP_013233599.1 pantoate--beta-alanine ligase, putative [Eimeria tenella]